MSGIKRMMVALAFSEFSETIFRYAASLAVDLDAQLVTAHIIDIRYVEAITHVESMGYEVSSETYIQGFKEERLSQLDEFAQRIAFPLEKMKKVVRVGHPYEQLLKAMEEERVDMAVIGTRAHSSMPHILVGSVAEKIFHHATVPVLFYRTV